MKQSDKYTYRVTLSEEDTEYAGLCAEFPGLSWLARTQQQVKPTPLWFYCLMNGEGGMRT